MYTYWNLPGLHQKNHNVKRSLQSVVGLPYQIQLVYPKIDHVHNIFRLLITNKFRLVKTCLNITDLHISKKFGLVSIYSKLIATGKHSTKQS